MSEFLYTEENLSARGKQLREKFIASRAKHPDINLIKGQFGTELLVEDSSYVARPTDNCLCPLGFVMIESKTGFRYKPSDEIYLELLQRQIPDADEDYFDGFWRGFDTMPHRVKFVLDTYFVDTEGFKDGMIFRQLYRDAVVNDF